MVRNQDDKFSRTEAHKILLTGCSKFFPHQNDTWYIIKPTKKQQQINGQLQMRHNIETN